MRLIDADALIVDTLKDPVGKLIAEQYNLIGFFEGRPTVEERKTGKWIRVPGYRTPDGAPAWACSECGKGEHVFGIEHGSCGARIVGEHWVACPNCGARME